MTTTRPWVVDTNVLLDCTSTRRTRHEQARELVTQRGELLITGQIAREYLVAATRPVESNGFGMALGDALANLTEFRRFLALLPEEKPTLPHLLQLLQDTACTGKTIHDANVVAAMLAHSVRTIVTSNPSHFRRFSKQVLAVDLAEWPQASDNVAYVCSTR